MADAAAAWTEARIERLKLLWAEGLSARQIAAELGGVSRNAVIGKVHRLGLSGRANRKVKAGTLSRSTTSTQHRSPAPKRSPAFVPAVSGNLAIAAVPVRVAKAAVEPVRAAEIVPMARYLTLAELEPSSCRWPIGDPASPNFRFCGAPTAAGKPYCAACSQKAYQVASHPARREDRRDPRNAVALKRFG